jgi:hypothetical protein
VSGVDRPGGGGPVPVRDLLKQLSGEAADARRSEPEAGPGSTDGEEVGQGAAPAASALEFEMGDESWVLRPAGVGAYGTGQRGAARLLAVHFYRAAEPDIPVREALMAAGAFGALRAEDAADLFGRATPIELNRGGS